MYKYISDNNLLSWSQSSFCIGNSCMYQLLSITHDLYHSSDEGFQTRAIFIDNSKTFSKVWLEGLIYKLRQQGFSDDLFIMGKY